MSSFNPFDRVSIFCKQVLQHVEIWCTPKLHYIWVQQGGVDFNFSFYDIGCSSPYLPLRDCTHLKNHFCSKRVGPIYAVKAALTYLVSGGVVYNILGFQTVVGFHVCLGS